MYNIYGVTLAHDKSGYPGYEINKPRRGVMFIAPGVSPVKNFQKCKRPAKICRTEIII